MHSSLCTGYALRNAEFRMMLNDALCSQHVSPKAPRSSSSSSTTRSSAPTSPSSASTASSSSRRGRPPSAANKKQPTSTEGSGNPGNSPGESSSSAEPEYMRSVPFRGKVDSSEVSGLVKWWDTELESKQEMSGRDYVSKLEAENAVLRDRLAASQSHDEGGGNRLLEFMKTLSSEKIASLQQGIGPQSEDAFRRISKSILGDLDSSKIQTTYSTSRDYMAQITYWCLLIGYTVRNLEKRSEMQSLFECTESLETSLPSVQVPPPQSPSSSSSSPPQAPSSS
jgi:hypothetical protein